MSERSDSPDHDPVPSYDQGQHAPAPQPAPPPPGGQIPGAEKKIVAGVLGILLGGLGIHKFVLGYTTEGIIMLAVSLVGSLVGCIFCLGMPAGMFVMGVIGLVEGIIYLTKTDQEFVDTYIQGTKTWF